MCFRRDLYPTPPCSPSLRSLHLFPATRSRTNRETSVRYATIRIQRLTRLPRSYYYRTCSRSRYWLVNLMSSGTSLGYRPDSLKHSFWSLHCGRVSLVASLSHAIPSVARLRISQSVGCGQCITYGVLVELGVLKVRVGLELKVLLVGALLVQIELADEVAAVAGCSSATCKEGP